MNDWLPSHTWYKGLSSCNVGAVFRGVFDGVEDLLLFRLNAGDFEGGSYKIDIK